MWTMNTIRHVSVFPPDILSCRAPSCTPCRELVRSYAQSHSAHPSATRTECESSSRRSGRVCDPVRHRTCTACCALLLERHFVGNSSKIRPFEGTGVYKSPCMRMYMRDIAVSASQSAYQSRALATI